MIPKTTTQSSPWRDLWSSISRGPYIGQDRRCFFCDRPAPSHTQDCLYLKVASTSILFSSDDDWHTLWQELIELGPWDKMGFCHYCGIPTPGLHAPDCPYWQAKLLDSRLQISESLVALKAALRESLR